MAKEKKYPVYSVLYYKNVLDKCFLRFFEEYNGSFVRDESGQFVFSGKISRKMLEKTFDSYIKDELSKYIVPYSASKPEFFIVIGSCVPGENFILGQIGDGDAQRKMKKLVDVVPDIRYFLKENDISVDMRLFNSAFEEIFVDYMTEKKTLGKNVIFLRHRVLDCYFIYKLLKQRYGSLLVNVHKDRNFGKDRCIFSVNEKLDDLCKRKLEILKSDAISPLRDEVYCYVDEKIRNV